MAAALPAAFRSASDRVRQPLLAALRINGFCEGRLASSALATAVAGFALRFSPVAGAAAATDKAMRWLLENRNADGSWGDTPDSPGNLTTTLLAVAALRDCPFVRGRLDASSQWLEAKTGCRRPAGLRRAILDFYGGDRTFSAPILMFCTAAGLFESSESRPWRQVPQLPFEFALLPPRLLPWFRLQVVSYALPALIAVGIVRHRRAPTRCLPLARLRDGVIPHCLRLLEKIQPAPGGFLEAAPLTGFVLLALALAGLAQHPVAARCAGFLLATVRPDGSWPVDVHLATWLTSMAVDALEPGAIDRRTATRVAGWLLDQQFRTVHPFTNAAPGGWAWTPRAGGVPDADDTAGTLVALHKLDAAAAGPAAMAGIRWLLGLQNSDGGFPTFCKGWGRLPFDRSCPDITAHTLRAFAIWAAAVTKELRHPIQRSMQRALRYLRRSQNPDGSWLPLWFGNQLAPAQQNPVWGTARAIEGLLALPCDALAVSLVARGCNYLLRAQGADGGWGGAAGVEPSIEETAVCVSALCCSGVPGGMAAAERGVAWLCGVLASRESLPAAPLGLYFAALWYSEEFYPSITACAALHRFGRALAASSA